jgi:predicted RND superfamily exporter protein
MREVKRSLVLHRVASFPYHQAMLPEQFHDIVLVDDNQDARLKELHRNQDIDEKNTPLPTVSARQPSPAQSAGTSTTELTDTVLTQVHLREDEDNANRTKVVVVVLAALVIIVTLFYVLQLSTALFYVLVITGAAVVLGVLGLLIKLLVEKCSDCIRRNELEKALEMEAAHPASYLDAA